MDKLEKEEALKKWMEDTKYMEIDAWELPKPRRRIRCYIETKEDLIKKSIKNVGSWGEKSENLKKLLLLLQK